jgi:pimeloyl-ACP methyl ester carboxylesterase
VINDEFPVSGSEIPLPDWSVFDDADLVDLDDELRASIRERAIPQPAGVATDTQVLTDPRRYDVPVTVVACEFPSAMIREWMEQGHPFTAELAQIKSVELVDLPTGHWPQFTRPADLADAISKAAEG